MNKSSIYQNIVENYNISPNYYADINLKKFEEKTLMTIIFSKFITDTIFTRTNQEYIELLIKDNYIYAYENEDLEANTSFYEDNMNLKNNNDPAISSPHINKSIIDFDVIKYSSDTSKMYLLYLDIISGIYNYVYLSKDNKEKYKSLTEIKIPCRYVIRNNSQDIFEAGSYDITLKIIRDDNINNTINDINLIGDIFVNKNFENIFKSDIIRHLNYLNGEDISYTTKKYLRDICYFYKFCRLKLLYSIVQSIYLLSKNPDNKINISEKISGYIRKVILPIFINFKELINLYMGDNKYETSKNVLYNTNVIETTNKLDTINKKIIKHKDKLSKNRNINNTILNKSTDVNIIQKIALIILISVIIISIIIIISPINNSSKGMLCYVISAIVLIGYIIMLIYLSYRPKVEERFLIYESKRFPPSMPSFIDYDKNLLEIKNQPYGNGIYNFDQSSVWDKSYANCNAVGVFDGNPNHGHYNSCGSWVSKDTWGSSKNSYTNNTVVNTDNNLTTFNNNQTYRGEWLQIKLPNTILLTSYSITIYQAAWVQLIDFIIVGSNDGKNWILIDKRYDPSWKNGWPNNKMIFDIIKPDIKNLFKYYRLCVNSVDTSRGGYWTLITEMYLFGEEGSVIEKQIEIENDLKLLQEAINKEAAAKEKLDNSTKLYNDALQKLKDTNDAFNRAKAELEKDKGNIQKQYEITKAQKDAENAELDKSLKEAQKIADEKAANAAQKEREALEKKGNLQQIIKEKNADIISINDLLNLRKNAMDKLQEFMTSSEKAQIAQITYLKSENAYKQSIELAKKNIIVENIKVKAQQEADILEKNLDVQNAKYTRDTAKLDADKKTEEEALAKIKMELAAKELQSKTDLALANKLQDANKILKNNIKAELDKIKSAKETYDQAMRDKEMAEQKASLLIAEANQKFNLGKTNIDDVNTELQIRINSEKALKAQADLEAAEQRKIELQQIDIETRAKSIIDFNVQIITDTNNSIKIYDDLLTKSREELRNITKTKTDLENQLTRITAKSQQDILNAENKYKKYDLETSKKIYDLKEEKKNLEIEVLDLQKKELEKRNEALKERTNRNNLEDELKKQLQIFKDLSDQVDYQKDITKDYEISYILRDVDVLILNNINDNINGINHDLVVPFLKIEKSAFDRYSNDLSAYTNKSVNDVNVQKINIQETRALINLYMLISLLFSSSLGINYYFNRLVSIGFSALFGIFITIIYNTEKNSIVRTSANNKYWTRPATFINKL